MELVRSGKVKEVYDEGENLLFVFTDKISVFDKIIPTLISGKGVSLCMTSKFWFDRLKEKGIRTHLLSVPEYDKMKVRKFSVLEKYDGKTEGNYLVPLEFVTRYYAAGSLMDRLKSGKVDFRDLGLSSMPEYGEKLPEPFFEVTTKFEKFDRPLDVKEATGISGLTEDELEEARKLILKIDSTIDEEVSRRGLIHADGKKELALDVDRNFVVVDTFGTADEDRFWDREEYVKGVVHELSKEFVRQYYRSTGYHEKLYEARRRGTKEPDIPPLPDDLKKKTEDLYRKMYSRITGLEWAFD